MAVGYLHDTPPPWPMGNCFELPRRPRGDRAPARGVHVINMHAENFGEIVKRSGLSLVEVELVGGQYLVVDPRIPRGWLRERPCSLCSRIGGAIPARYADRFGGPASRP